MHLLPKAFLYCVCVNRTPPHENAWFPAAAAVDPGSLFLFSPSLLSTFSLTLFPSLTANTSIRFRRDPPPNIRLRSAISPPRFVDGLLAILISGRVTRRTVALLIMKRRLPTPLFYSTSRSNLLLKLIYLRLSPLSLPLT